MFRWVGLTMAAVLMVLWVTGCDEEEANSSGGPVALGPGVWVTDKGADKILKFGFGGAKWGDVADFSWPVDVAVREADGTVWVADTAAAEVVKVRADGQVIKRLEGFNAPEAVAVNQSDGSCWMADVDAGNVYRIDAAGNVKVNVGGFNSPYDVDCYAADGSAWVADTYNHRVVKLNADGTQALVVALTNVMPTAVAVDPRNGDVWVGCAQKLLKLSGGTVVKDISGVYNVWNVAVDPRDGSLALADEKAIRKFDADGNKVWEDTDYDFSYGVAVNKNTGAVWATDLLNPRLVEYSAVGNKQLEVTAGLVEPLDVALTY